MKRAKKAGKNSHIDQHRDQSVQRYLFETKMILYLQQSSARALYVLIIAFVRNQDESTFHLQYFLETYTFLLSCLKNHPTQERMILTTVMSEVMSEVLTAMFMTKQ